MPVFSGITSGSILQVAKDLPSGVLSFRLSNQTAGSIVVNMYIRNGSNVDVPVLNKDYTMDEGDLRVEDDFIKILKGSSIYLITSGSVADYFSIEKAYAGI